VRFEVNTPVAETLLAEDSCQPTSSTSCPVMAEKLKMLTGHESKQWFTKIQPEGSAEEVPFDSYYIL
jgi:hypothetical protein